MVSIKRRSIEISEDELRLALDRIKENHVKYITKNNLRVSAVEEDVIFVDGLEYMNTPWALLIDLITHFLKNYLKDGKVKFSFWTIGRNFQTIVKLINFILSVRKAF